MSKFEILNMTYAVVHTLLHSRNELIWLFD